MNFPITRHYQRYEYILEMGYVHNKNVVDVGCGLGYGLHILDIGAACVVGIDPELAKLDPKANILVPPIIPGQSKQNVFRIAAKFEDAEFAPADVITAIEVFEHVPDPTKFCEWVAKHCHNAFFTTPLAEVTGPTDNKEHVAEYSGPDFRRILETSFEILDFKFQLSDMSIVPMSRFNGCSLISGHVVQMAWCRSKLASPVEINPESRVANT